jgi:adenine deaminase
VPTRHCNRPRYGQAHSLLAWVLLRRSTWSRDLRTLAPEIHSEIQTALSVDDRDPWAYFAQGNLFNRLRRPGDGVRAIRRALELNPNSRWLTP